MVTTALDRLDPPMHRHPTSFCPSTPAYPRGQWASAQPPSLADFGGTRGDTLIKECLVDYSLDAFKGSVNGHGEMRVEGRSHEIKELMAAEAIADLSRVIPASRGFPASSEIPTATHKGLPRVPQRGSPSHVYVSHPALVSRSPSHVSYQMAPRHRPDSDGVVKDARRAVSSGDDVLTRHSGDFKDETLGDVVSEANISVVEALMVERHAASAAAAAHQQQQQQRVPAVTTQAYESYRGQEARQIPAKEIHGFGSKDDTRNAQRLQLVEVKPECITPVRVQACDRFVRTGCYMGPQWRSHSSRSKFEVRSDVASSAYRDEESQDERVRSRCRHYSDISPDADMPLVVQEREQDDSNSERCVMSSDHSNGSHFAIMKQNEPAAYSGRPVVEYPRNGSSEERSLRYLLHGALKSEKDAKENGHAKHLSANHIAINTVVPRNFLPVIQISGVSENSWANTSGFPPRRQHIPSSALKDKTSSTYLRRQAAYNAAVRRSLLPRKISQKTDTETELLKVRSGKYGSLACLSSYYNQLRNKPRSIDVAMDLSVTAQRPRSICTENIQSNNIMNDLKLSDVGFVKVDPRPTCGVASGVNNWVSTRLVNDSGAPIKVDHKGRRACEEITVDKTAQHRAIAGRDSTVAPGASNGGLVLGQMQRKTVGSFPANATRSDSPAESLKVDGIRPREHLYQSKPNQFESTELLNAVQIKCESSEDGFSERVQHVGSFEAVLKKPTKREFPDDCSPSISSSGQPVDVTQVKADNEVLLLKSEQCTTMLPDCQLPPKKRRMFDQKKVEDLLNDCNKGQGFTMASSYHADSKVDGDKALIEQPFLADEKSHEAVSRDDDVIDENRNKISGDVPVSELPSAVQPDEDGDLPLHIAVVQGNLLVVERLLRVMRQLGVSIDTANHLRQTPLHLAIITNQLEAARRLLAENASTELSDRLGNNGVHLAVKYNSSDCFQLLLEHASSNGRRQSLNVNAMNYDGLTPLHLAVQHSRPTLLLALLRAGAIVNAPDGKNGRTALYFAAEQNDVGAARALMAHGADTGLVSYSGCTAAQAAAARSHLDLLRLLEQPGK